MPQNKKWDGNIALALQFTTNGHSLLGFEFHPVKEEEDADGHYIRCPEDEAAAWGVYALLDDGKEGHFDSWIADLDQHAAAQAFCDILNNIRTELTGKKALSEFIHPSIEGNLEMLNNQQPYNFLIERNTAGWKLYITEADTDLEFDYNTKDEAENDVRMAQKHYQLELIDISELPSVG